MMTDDSPADIQRKLDGIVDPWPEMGCACVGPRDDDPVCPCEMKYVIRYRDTWIGLKKISSKTNRFSHTVTLLGFDPSRKIQLIGVVRRETRSGLVEAKELVESSLLKPVVIQDELWSDAALRLQAELEQVGGKVEID
jgi:ribosomal protein L7/L12